MENDAIPLDLAKQLIIKALTDCDPTLGHNADAILNDPKRLNVIEETESKTGMMQCRPAGLTLGDLKAMDPPQYREDYAGKFGPHFTQQDNPTDKAIIDYEYTYTKDSVLYLAHELGHAIADDVQRENGLTFRDFTENQLEEQAYFIQSIVADALDPGFNNQSRAFHDSDMSEIFNRETQRHRAVKSYEEALTLQPETRGSFIRELLGGKPREKDNEGVPAGHTNGPVLKNGA